MGKIKLIHPKSKNNVQGCECNSCEAHKRSNLSSRQREALHDRCYNCHAGTLEQGTRNGTNVIQCTNCSMYMDPSGYYN